MKRVLVVGASKGMGLAIAQRCADEGHQVLTMQRTEPETPIVQALPWMEFDYAWPYEQIKRRVLDGVQALDGLDWLVLAGGMGAYMGALDFDPQKAEQMMRVNYFGPRYVFQAAVKYLKRSSVREACRTCLETDREAFCWECGGKRTTRKLLDDPSRVLFLGSTVAQPPGATALEDYAATKGAISGLIPSLARHYNRWGIRVLEFATSWVETPMTDAIRDQNPELYWRIRQHVPLKRMATVQETTDAMYHLLSGPEFWAGGQVRFTGGAN